MSKHISTRTLFALLVGTALATTTSSAQTTWYVDDDAPGDPGPGDPTVSDPNEDGSSAHPFDAIQEGIDAAVDGDTVLVADGTYTGDGNRDIDFGGRLITVRSENGPETCTIDCEGDDGNEHRGFHFHSGETADAGLDGFTIRNGYNEGDAGGGIRCGGSSPTISNCTLKGNSANHGRGGGVYCAGSNPTMINCTISGSAYWGGGVCCDGSSPKLVNCTISHGGACLGGGLYCAGSSPTLINCTINGNSSWFGPILDGGGGGVCCDEGSSPTLTNCTISGNSAPRIEGGGVFCRRESSPKLTNCTITGNSADGGGGVYCASYCSPTLTNCTIAGNVATGNGGGMYCYDANPSGYYSSGPTLTNCTISGNSAYHGGGFACENNSSPTLANCTISANSGQFGGGVYCNNSSPTLTNCTISGNVADHGGGVVCENNSNPILTNCLLWNDTPREIRVYSDSVPVVTYCDIQGGWRGEGNVDADPLFVDPDGPDNDPNTWEDNDHRLRPGSPCIDAGDNTAVPPDTLDLDDDGDTDEPLPFDLDANPRFLDDPAATDSGKGTPPIVDMGVYEACLGDFDGDGVLDCEDGCPNDPNTSEAGVCGCGVPETDSDGDGVPDCVDGCPDDPNKTEPGICGCGVPETDSDGDGVPDCADGCPDDPNKTEPGACDCNFPDTDSDGDGTADCADNCPDDPNKTEPGICGCGVPDDACGDSQLPAPAGWCPGVATLMLTLTFLGLLRTRSGRHRGKRQGVSAQPTRRRGRVLLRIQSGTDELHS